MLAKSGSGLIDYDTCMADVVCQLCSLLHVGYPMLLMLWLNFVQNVCFIDGGLFNNAHSSKLSKAMNQDLAGISVGLV